MGRRRGTEHQQRQPGKGGELHGLIIQIERDGLVRARGMRYATAASASAIGDEMDSWFSEILGRPEPAEGESVAFDGCTAVMRAGVLRLLGDHEALQDQTREMFGFKWGKRDTYASPEVRTAQIAWLSSRYSGKTILEHLGPTGHTPTVLDAGCGSGFTASCIFDGDWRKISYVGADISSAVDIARETISPMAGEARFVQADLTKLPFQPESFDVVLSEGVLHHTPSTMSALFSIAPLVRPGGILAIYVYNKKGAVREFTDDLFRDLVRDMPPEQAWEAMKPITSLGIELGKLNATVDVQHDIPVLGIKAGKIDVQRLFYWSVLKAYYRPEFSFDEMNHINFDWYTPQYAHRQTPDEVSAWVAEAGLVVEHMKTEEAGITVVARRPQG